ncbi:MAG: hypothetical protein KGI54_13650 [Pseudomonadota bacterium]|nr:hypothetical protein [Pseudomonadota bacterium]
MGTTLTVDNQISPVIARLIEDFTKLQKLSDSVNRSFAGINKSKSGIDSLARSVQNLNAQLSAVVKNAGRAAGAMGGMGSGGGYSGGGSTRPASSSPFYAPMPFVAGTGWQYGNNGGGGMPPYYSQAALGGYGGGPLRLTGPGIKDINGGAWHTSGNMAAGAALAAGAGAGGGGRWRWPGMPSIRRPNMPRMGYMESMMLGMGAYGVMSSGMHNAAALDSEHIKLKLYGMSKENNAAAEAFADQMNIPSVDKIHAARFFNEALGVFRESGNAKPLESAKVGATILAKLYASTAGMEEGGRQMTNSQALSMLRVLEMRGANKGPADMERIADQMWKLNTTSSGLMDWELMRQFFTIGGVPAKNMSVKGLAMMEPFITEQKSRAATGLSTAYNRINGLIKLLPVAAVNEFANLGLWDMSKVKRSKGGSVKEFINNQNPFKYEKQFLESPVEFYRDVMMPIYQKKGLNSSQQDRENMLLFGTTGGKLFSLIDSQLTKAAESEKVFNQALGVTNTLTTAMTGKQFQLNVVGEKWSNLLTELGTEEFPTIIAMMNAFMVPIKGLIGIFKGANYLGEKIASTPFLGDVVGGGAAVVASIFGSDEAKGAIHANAEAIRKQSVHTGKSASSGRTGGDVYLDKRKVGSVMFSDLHGPQKGRSFGDFVQSLPAPSMPGGR